MAKLYLQAGDDLVGAFKQVVANPNTQIIAANGKPITLQRLGSLAFNPQQTQEGIANSVAQQALVAQEVVANQAAANVAGTKPSTDTLANLGGAGTVTDANKINTQGSLNPYDTMDATGATPEKVVTPPVTPPVTGLTLADLQKQGYLTNDQLKTALAGQQTALTSQNANFLKDWNTSADALKTNILSGVDTKNQAFGTQATQGFMDAFKNFQIPTNQQTGVNLGNYNDNRNAAADQWWSQYVTGRR